MRIAFVGKGGSGKTTLASVFALYVKKYFGEVLVIDADINQHLKDALFGVNHISTKSSLSEETIFLKKNLRGNNGHIASSAEMLKTTPPGIGSRKLSLKEINPVWEKYIDYSRGIKLINTGEVSEEDIGTKCYHSKTGSVELLLNHLKDEQDECVILDMTAGADAFSSGLFTKFDLTCIVVEPTLKSISVFQQYKKYCEEFDVRLCAIGNKIVNNEDIAFLNLHLSIDMLGVFHTDQRIRESERGNLYEIEELDPRNTETMKTLMKELELCERDWKKYQEQTYFFHEKNALSWGNAEIGKDLRMQIDPVFSYQTW